jgi:hypothetical protein
MFHEQLHHSLSALREFIRKAKTQVHIREKRIECIPGQILSAQLQLHWCNRAGLEEVAQLSVVRSTSKLLSAVGVGQSVLRGDGT